MPPEHGWGPASGPAHCVAPDRLSAVSELQLAACPHRAPAPSSFNHTSSDVGPKPRGTADGWAERPRARLSPEATPV